MIKIHNLTMKNFMSIGNVSQSMSFTESELFLILGENLDLGGGDNRNGVGKTSIANALSYGLYGKPLVSIRLENLINKTNAKGMFVTIDFERDNVQYRIERGRKPNVFRFYVDNKELEQPESDSDEAQGENRMTQMEIEKILNLSHDMFKHLIALNTYTEPFLSMKAGDQRAIIEQLLGITKLSEKAEALKILIRESKNSVLQESFRIKGVMDANALIESNIKGLERKRDAWLHQHRTELVEIESDIQNLEGLNIEEEIELHHEKEVVDKTNHERVTLEKEHKTTKTQFDSYVSQLTALEKKHAVTETKSCHTCGQSIDDEMHKSLVDEINLQITELKVKRDFSQSHLRDLTEALESLGPKREIETFYPTIREAYEHKNSIQMLRQRQEKEKATNDPYSENIESLKQSALQEVNYEKINGLEKMQEHQEFLLRLLTNKDSFIRKKIINQNLSYLNKRLDHFLSKMGLPHNVNFLPDLSVEISEHGRELDFDNLSRGERTRLILSISWAFRDVYESLNEKYNLLYIDELIDNGLDLNGVEASLGILKKMSRDDKRCVHLISHREELAGRVDNVIKVVKENGFTSIESDS